MLAKEYRIPVLVVDCLEKGEVRAFPYLGNTKTIRYSGCNEIFCIQTLSLAMSEILSKLYQKETTNQMVDIYGVSINTKNVFDYPPELLSLNSCTDKIEKTVIYPEPPLGHFEIDMLNKCWPNVKLVTPISIPSLMYKSKLKGIKIGISVSEPRVKNNHGIGLTHCMALSLEIARYLLANEVDLYYGGDINYTTNKNFTKSLIDLVEIYNNEHSENKKRITNYVANYLSQYITDDQREDLNENVKFRIMKSVDVFDELETEQEMKQKVIKAVYLTNMRDCMNKDIDARIVLGGKTDGFTGMYPGILEEVIKALSDNKPVYLLGGYGGITSEIVKCISGEKSEIISNERLKLDENENSFVEYVNSLSGLNLQKINYDDMSSMLANRGISGLNNGLTDDENRKLFKSRNMNEIISLILNGLYAYCQYNGVKTLAFRRNL